MEIIDGEVDIYDPVYFAKIRKVISDLIPKWIHPPGPTGYSDRDRLIIEHLLNEESMINWVKAFTTPIASATFNYEVLETYGDRVISLSIIRYLITKFPNISSEELTQVKTTFESNKTHSGYSKLLGIDKCIRTVPSKYSVITPKVIFDVYESFMGALFVNLDRLREGLGYGICYHLVARILDMEDITDPTQYADNKTNNNQIFMRFGLGDLEMVETRPPGGRYQIDIRLTVDQMKWLRSLGKIFPTELLGRGIDHDREDAIRIAHQKAAKTLANKGVNRFWAEDLKAKLMKETYGTKDLYESILKSAHILGFEDVEFMKPKDQDSSKKVMIYRLLGFRTEDVKNSSKPEDVQNLEVAVVPVTKEWLQKDQKTRKRELEKEILTGFAENLKRRAAQALKK